jgi:DNA adenine methylase
VLDIRRAFKDFNIMETDIKYSTGSVHGKPATSTELIIMNYEPTGLDGGLF